MNSATKLLKFTTTICAAIGSLGQLAELFKIVKMANNPEVQEVINHFIWTGKLLWCISLPSIVIYLLWKYISIENDMNKYKEGVAAFIKEKVSEFRADIELIEQKIEKLETDK